MLGSQLGIGAYRALVEGEPRRPHGERVLAAGPPVPFHELVNPDTLRTELRFIEVDSDFHRLAKFLDPSE